MSWFLKYRPKQIKDLDLTDVRQSFLKMMEAGKIPQTMLFAGPKGTGKTSTSRIIGAMLNDPANEKIVDSLYFDQKSIKDNQFEEPDPESDFADRVYRGQSFVVQEMDAASNRGIDDIRQLKERITLPPQEGKMAVYILDEVHMLTNQAFNALLKILEEPPSHVVFILATTEMHKVPATIVSRCSTISFRKASVKEVVGRLEKILKKEEVDYEQQALKQIAFRADGSFRDAVKLAELAAQSGEITPDRLEAVVGGSAEARVTGLVKSVLTKDQAQVAQVFKDLRQENFDQDYFYKTFFQLLHRSLLQSMKIKKGEPVVNQSVAKFLLKELMKVDLSQPSPISFLPMELRLLEIIERAKQNDDNSGRDGEGNETDHSSKNEKKSPQKKTDLKNETEQATENKEERKAQQDSSAEIASEVNLNQFKQQTQQEKTLNPVEDSTNDSLSQIICDQWPKLINSVAEKNSTVAALLRSGKPTSGPNGTAKVKVFYSFHQEQLRQPKFKSLIEKCGSQLVGSKIRFKFILTNPPEKAELVDVPAKSEKLEALAEETLM